MKTLYVSDLDGTLLNKNEKLDLITANQINQLITNGIYFTVSTGRGDSTRKILSNINFNLPIMVLNGTLNYDFSKQEYIDALPIAKKTVLEMIEALKNFDSITFEIQTMIDNQVNRFDISKWNQVSPCLSLNILHSAEKSEKLAEILSKINGINFFIHKKVYSEGECFCDIVLENVSKASRLKQFKEYYRFDKVIAFGDSENDLPLAEFADEFYAVENAEECVKERATKVIGSCYDNGVVKFIIQNEFH